MTAIRKKTNGQAGDDGNRYLRNCRIEVRVSPDELAQIRANGLASGFQQSAPYLRSLGVQGLTTEHPRSQRKALVTAQRQLSRIGTNLNQIARKVNAGEASQGEILVTLLQIADFAETILHDASYGVES